MERGAKGVGAEEGSEREVGGGAGGGVAVERGSANLARTLQGSPHRSSVNLDDVRPALLSIHPPSHYLPTKHAEQNQQTHKTSCPNASSQQNFLTQSTLYANNPS